MKLYTLLALSMLVPFSALAQTTTAVSDANDPTKERYCDPTANADILAKIQSYQNNLEKLNGQNSNDSAIQRIALMNKINAASKKVKCVYRTSTPQN